MITIGGSVILRPMDPTDTAHVIDVSFLCTKEGKKQTIGGILEIDKLLVRRDGSRAIRKSIMSAITDTGLEIENPDRATTLIDVALDDLHTELLERSKRV